MPRVKSCWTWSWAGWGLDRNLGLASFGAFSTSFSWGRGRVTGVWRVFGNGGDNIAVDGRQSSEATATTKYRDLSTAQQTVRLSVASVEMTFVFGEREGEQPKTTAEADPFGMTNNGAGDGNSKGKDKTKYRGFSAAQQTMRLSVASVEMTSVSMSVREDRQRHRQISSR
jgi:hypothetical protein